MTVGWLEGYLQEVHWRSVRGIYCNHMCFLDGVENLCGDKFKTETEDKPKFK